MPEQAQDNPIYKFMKSNNLTQLDEKAFLDKYSAPEKAKEIHSFMVSNKLTDLDDTKFYDKYLKKKDQAVSLSVSSPTQSLSPDFEKGKAFAEKGFLMQPEGTKAPKQQEVKAQPVEKQGWLLNTVSALDKGFAKNFISSPIKGLGTALQGVTKKVMGGTGEGVVSDNLIKFGDYLNNAIDELTPQDEEFKGTLTDQVAQAFGQVGSLVFTGGLAGAAGKGAALVSQVPKGSAAATAAKTLGSQLASPTAVSAGLAMGQAEFDRAIEAGANDDQAFEAFYKNAAVGSVLETIPVMQFFKRFNNTTGGSVANYIKTKGVAGLTGGIEEMTTEVLQQIYSNKTAKDIYNINQEILDGVGTSGGIGFGVGFVLNAMGANAKILRKQGKAKEADALENQVKQYEDNLENPKVTSGNKVSAKDIVTQGVEVGTQKAVKNLDRDLANNVITPEQYQEGIVFAEKAAQVADKIPETVTGESRAKSIELLVERNDINQANQNLLQQKQTTDVAYHAGIDQEIKTNEERIKKIDAEVYNIAKKPSKEFGGKKYIVDGEEVSQAEFEALQGKPTGTKQVVRAIDEYDALDTMTPEESQKLADLTAQGKSEEASKMVAEKLDQLKAEVKPTEVKVTEEVEPLKENEYYHATDATEIIAPSEKGYKKREGANVVGEGIYFGKDKEQLTDRYGKNAIKVELDIKNPLISDNKYIIVDGREIDVQSLSKEDIKFLKEKGYDAVKYVTGVDEYSGYDETIVFDKNQIKSQKLITQEVKPTEVKEKGKAVKVVKPKLAPVEEGRTPQVKPLSKFKVGDKFVFATDRDGSERTVVSIDNGIVTFKSKGSKETSSASEIQRLGNDLALLKSDWDKGIRPNESEFKGSRFKSKTKPTKEQINNLTKELLRVNYRGDDLTVKTQGKPGTEGYVESAEDSYREIAKQYLENDLDIVEVVDDLHGGKERLQKIINGEAPKKTYQEAVKEKLEADKKQNRQIGAEKATVTKEIYRRVNQMDAPVDAEQVALRYLADGGTVSKEAVDEAYGSVKRAELNVKRKQLLSEEVKSKDFVKGNETLDDLAHRLWEANDQKIPEDKIKDKLMAEIGNNNTRLEAAEAYLDKYNAEYKLEKEEMRMAELYKEQYLEEQAEIEKELRKPLDEQIEGEASEEHINNLIKQYEAEIKGEDQQLRPEGQAKVDRETSKGKVAEKNETELAKEYKEVIGKASKKAKENAKKDFVDRNFDNIVEKLKIQIKCPT